MAESPDNSDRRAHLRLVPPLARDSGSDDSRTQGEILWGHIFAVRTAMVAAEHHIALRPVDLPPPPDIQGQLSSPTEGALFEKIWQLALKDRFLSTKKRETIRRAFEEELNDFYSGGGGYPFTETDFVILLNSIKFNLRQPNFR